MSSTEQPDGGAPRHDGSRAGGPLRRFAPLVLIAAAMVLVFALGWHEHLSFRTIGLNYEALRGYIAGNLVVSVLAYMALYVAVVALSLPGGLVMTLSGGLLFGWAVAAPATVVAATIGATVVFLVARSSFGESLAARAGPWLARLSAGFRENAMSYLLFLRLVPAFPFFVVNLAPALLGVPLRTYVVGTFLGIIPATTAFSVLGSGLGSAIESQNGIYNACLDEHGARGVELCRYSIDTKALVTPELLTAFALLGLVALIPVAIKKVKTRSTEHGNA